jgi:hypothetical protein
VPTPQEANSKIDLIVMDRDFGSLHDDFIGKCSLDMAEIVLHIEEQVAMASQFDSMTNLAIGTQCIEDYGGESTAQGQAGWYKYTLLKELELLGEAEVLEPMAQRKERGTVTVKFTVRCCGAAHRCVSCMRPPVCAFCMRPPVCVSPA